ncbi:hypothetical protein TCAL_10367 [Tigriopus californicus]|uniref:Major facilitator superfamily (MFS) profile domain-containing protein n=1 Tax=Tigriopus californicus TaxID=6832 RepID=A0A553PTN5_TIGCA|nr:facilitated trehalose transporter Tret1-like [Tigriopus californicus]TRY81048.1 hypothetical protein TCAL_10367 [Tigriopus californicus]|eukprot:TCALIF_10367-PA protein Name:"Similar to Tret1 Facilitated trehalose transporter Tret1 (Bombyx mori)" AED:0.07 eAED:0.07 QI:429/1/0.8/1/0.5/0.6/5/0/523
MTIVRLTPTKEKLVPRISHAVSSKARSRTQIYALVPIYLLQFCYGMNTGFPAILTPQLREPCSEFMITENQESWIVSLDNVATPLICLCSGILQQRYGPKYILVSACVPYLLGWIMVVMATNVECLYISRVLVGISHALITTTVYTVEITSREMRGTLSLWESVVRCAGCLLIYCMGFFLRWNRIALIAPVIPLMALISCFYIPESPVYLVRQRRFSRASQSLKQLFGSKYNVTEEIELINSNLDHESGQHNVFEVLKSVPNHPEIYKPFGIVLLLSAIQQFSGMSILRAYVVKIFDSVFHETSMPEFNHENVQCDQSQTSKEAYISAIVIGLVRLLSSLLLSNFLKVYPRRSLYLTSITLSVISLVSLASVQLCLQKNSDCQPLQWLVLVFACGLVFSVQLGVQTLPMLLSGELFSSDIRALGKSMIRSLTCVFLVISLKTYPALQGTLDIYGTFFLFSIVLAGSAPLIYWLLPETKDLSLETIQHYFQPAKTQFYVDLHHTTNKSTPVPPSYNYEMSNAGL